MQEKLMNAIRQSKAVPGMVSKPSHLTNTGPFLQRASILFVAGVSSLIGASLLLASI